MRIASIDIGTNTALCLIAESEGAVIRVLHDGHGIARLGEGVDKTGVISEAAYQRFRAILAKHLEAITRLRVERVAAIATSAMRDAKNRDEIIQRTKSETGIEIDILSGDDEAHWTYRGALVGMTNANAADVAVLDIGGGSTEISIGDGHEFRSGISTDIGAVRLTERCFATTPITAEAANDSRLTIRNILREKLPIPFRTNTLVAVAGTPTTLAAMHQGLPVFDKSRVQGYTLTRSGIQQLLDIMSSVNTQTLLDHFPTINKDRADILPAGTLILCEVMDYLGSTSVIVSTRGLRYGIALREFERASEPADWTIVE